MVRSITLNEAPFKIQRSMRENTLAAYPDSQANFPVREDFSEYVAHLQLHMTLHARKLVPTLTKTADSREQLLHQTQANFEKFVSRQVV